VGAFRVRIATECFSCPWRCAGVLAGFVFVKGYGVTYLGADGYVDSRNSSNHTEEEEEEEE